MICTLCGERGPKKPKRLEGTQLYMHMPCLRNLRESLWQFKGALEQLNMSVANIERNLKP